MKKKHNCREIYLKKFCELPIEDQAAIVILAAIIIKQMPRDNEVKQ
jgi:hypothetical protein